MFTGEYIWVIGASSGIGSELCKQLASKGATLILSARRIEKLNKLKQTLGEKHFVFPLDVSNEKQVNEVIQGVISSIKKIDRVIFMAAIYRPQLIKEMDISFTRKIVEVNLLGAIYCSHAVLPILMAQKKGQIAICASSAGFMGLSGGQPYSATKAALINFTESLYAEVEKPIDIKVINPGFVKTPMTEQNKFHMPMQISVEEAAKAILTGLTKRGFEIHFPKCFTCLLKFIACFPYYIKLWFTKKLKNK